jgi:anti-sigma regulatory factor (Ser/Thr protein kinase)
MLFPLFVTSAASAGSSRRSERDFEAEPQSAPSARRFVLSKVGDQDEELTMHLSTMVSELATNAILHAGTAFKVIVLQDGARIRVSVHDMSPAPPVMKSFGQDQPTGRGLVIVDSMADRWGVESENNGKTVWFELATGTHG